MSIEYDFYRNPNSQGSNIKRYHARVVSSDRISTDELAEEIQKECSLTITDVKAVLIALGDKLAKHLGDGSKVHLEGIGYFQVNLQCKEEVCTTRSVRSDNVEFKSVSYRADNELKKHLRNQKIQRSQTRIHSREMTEEEIIEFNTLVLRSGSQDQSKSMMRDELATSITYETNLMSYLDTNVKLLDYEIIDDKKADWYDQDEFKGLPRIELLTEFEEKTGNKIWFYTIQQFIEELEKHCKIY